MKGTLASLTVLALALVPELAAAKAVEGVRIDTDANDVIITVVADEALAKPAVRTAPGSVRVRFYDAIDTRIQHVNGDGAAVRGVDLNRGSDQTAALTINFGDRTKLLHSDVRVESAGDTTTLRIARGLLPAVREGAASTAAAKPLPAPVAPAVAKSAATPAAAPVAASKPAVTAPVLPAAAAPAAAPSASTVLVSSEETVQPEVVKPVAAAPAKPLLGKKKAQPAEELKLNSSSSPMPVLLAVSALLAIAYAALQFTMRKKRKLPGTDFPAIDVIAQRRIGPRHQLVIVRAFDRDYLLSIQGGQTTVVARSSRKKLLEAEALLAPVAPREELPNRAFERDDEPTFGGELFKQALEQRERARENTASMRLAERDPWEAAANAYGARREPTASVRTEGRREPTSGNRAEARREPTSGMRREARESSARLEAIRMELDSDLPLDRDDDALDREDSDFAPLPPSAMSDSVSGLLRLRKQSGR